METTIWPTRQLAVANLFLDYKNPRLGRETINRSPREIVQYLFEHDKAIEVAQSIATRMYFPNEPLLAVKEEGHYVVVEGNRRLAALKALREPGLLEGNLVRQVERLARRIGDIESIAKVPVTIATSRRATDRQIAGRHLASPVLAWRPENRASFILEKLEEGYDNDELLDELGFTVADIQKARQTRAIADMARSLDLPDKVKAKLDGPHSKVFSTLERVFESSVGRQYLKVDTDPEYGLRGTTAKADFVTGYTQLVTDIAMGTQSTRTLNTNENIKAYFESLPPECRATGKRGSFVPSDIIKGSSSTLPKVASPSATPTQRSKPQLATVLPRSLKVRHGSARLIDIHRELIRLKRASFPNAGAVLLRVFFELVVLDYLERTGDLKDLIQRLKNKSDLQFGTPTMKQLVPEIKRIAEQYLEKAAAQRVVKAVQYNAEAPFTLSDLHAFVHQASDLPGERDILQFWLRTEPLFRLMLEDGPEHGQK